MPKGSTVQVCRPQQNITNKLTVSSLKCHLKVDTLSATPLIRT